MAGGREDPDDVDAIFAALEDGDLETALRRIDATGEADIDPVLGYLRGRALLLLDRPVEAEASLQNACRMDPDDLDYRSEWALVLFRLCRFEEAERLVRQVLATEPDRPDDLELLGMLCERRGEEDEADLHFLRAGALDPERFPEPVRLDEAGFRRVVVEAGEELPETFRRHLDEVAVTVEDVPSAAILTEGDPPLDPGELLGLFVGVALPDRTHLGPGGDLPPRILLFRRNLERYAEDVDDLREQIKITLYHELGHYLGFDEDDLVEMDLG